MWCNVDLMGCAADHIVVVARLSRIQAAVSYHVPAPGDVVAGFQNAQSGWPDHSSRPVPGQGAGGYFITRAARRLSFAPVTRNLRPGKDDGANPGLYAKSHLLSSALIRSTIRRSGYAPMSNLHRQRREECLCDWEFAVPEKSVLVGDGPVLYLGMTVTHQTP